MSQIFLNIINMSISASYIVLAVLLLRLLLKKATKWITVVLWGIVAVRLICPFSIESVLSLIPSAETISPSIMTDSTPTINTGIPILNNTLNPIIGESLAPALGDSANPLQVLVPICTAIWIVGMVALLVYTVISYVRVKRKIGTAVLYKNNIFQSESVVSPFVLGLVKPKIYLPFNMSGVNMVHVVAHEQAHIRRKDHLWKPLGFILLTLHWFNPLMWLGYVFLCRDIELACDEKVIKELDHDARADYSQALLTCSVNRRMIAACPLAFGEVGVKDRVKSVLNYKKPAFWIIIAAIVACIVAAVCFLTNPINLNNSVDDELKVYIDCQIAERFQTEKSEGRACCLDWEVIGKKQSGSTTTLYMWVLYKEYSYNGTELKSETGAHIPTVITVKKEDGHFKLIEYWEAKDGSYHSTSIKEKFPWYLHSKALDSQRYIDAQRENCLQMALDYFGLTSVPELNDENEPNSLIYGFVPPASDSDKLSYIYIQDYGCDVKDIGIEVKRVHFVDNCIIFDILWNSESPNEHDIGPDFKVYKYDKDKPIELEHNNVWQYVKFTINGSLKTDGSYPETMGASLEHSYNVGAHYDVLTPGKYRFEAHGAWVEFQIVDNFSTISLAYDNATFDIDGDGVDENCSMRHGYTSGLFTFIFLVQDKETGETEYETRIYSQVYDLSFQKGTDGITRVQGITRDETPETHLFDISISDGNVNLTENGVPIGEIAFDYSNNISLIYGAPIYSFVMDPSAVPTIEIEDNVIYTITEGIKERLGTVTNKSLNYFNFDAFIKKYDGFDHSELVRELRQDNKKAYEVQPDSPKGVDLYYIMEQANGDMLIVYGHYEDGERVNEIRFIYSISQ